MDGVLQPPVCTELSAGLIMIILVLPRLLELWIDGCACSFLFPGVSSFSGLQEGGKFVISTGQSAKC